MTENINKVSETAGQSRNSSHAAGYKKGVAVFKLREALASRIPELKEQSNAK